MSIFSCYRAVSFFYCAVLVSFFSPVVKRRFLTTALIFRARGRNTARSRVSLIEIRNNRRQSYRNWCRGGPRLPPLMSPSRRVASVCALCLRAREPPRAAICLLRFSPRPRRIYYVTRRAVCVFKANAESMTVYFAAFESVRVEFSAPCAHASKTKSEK